MKTKMFALYGVMLASAMAGCDSAPPRVEQLTPYGGEVEGALPDGRTGPSLSMPERPRVVEVVEARPDRSRHQRRQVVGQHRLARAVGAVDRNQHRPPRTRNASGERCQDVWSGYDASSSPRRRHCSSNHTLALPIQPAASWASRPSVSWVSRKASE